MMTIVSQAGRSLSQHCFYAPKWALRGSGSRKAPWEKKARYAWEAAVDDHRVGAQLQWKMDLDLLVLEWHIALGLMIYTLNIAIAQHHVLPGPPIRLNLLTMLGPISSYSALV